MPLVSTDWRQGRDACEKRHGAHKESARETPPGVTGTRSFLWMPILLNCASSGAIAAVGRAKEIHKGHASTTQQSRAIVSSIEGIASHHFPLREARSHLRRIHIFRAHSRCTEFVSEAQVAGYSFTPSAAFPEPRSGSIASDPLRVVALILEIRLDFTLATHGCRMQKTPPIEPGPKLDDLPSSLNRNVHCGGRLRRRFTTVQNDRWAIRVRSMYTH